MNRLKKFLKPFILQLIVLQHRQTTGIVIETSEREERTKLAETAVKILTSCHESGITAGVVGKAPDYLIAPLSSNVPVDTIDDGDWRAAVDTEPVSRTNRYRLNLFVITVTSTREIEKLVAKIKNTRWWNHMADFYIFNDEISENGCSKAQEYLWTAWRNNLLEVKFLCIDNTKKKKKQQRARALIYTFNPYTRDAPKPWKFVTSIHEGHAGGHPWSLLMREYEEDPKLLCENMNFDRTKNLGGYPIRVLKLESSLEDFATNSALYDDNMIGKKFLSNVLFGSLNVTLRETVVMMEYDVIARREQYNSNESSPEDIDDVELISRDESIMLDMTATYPHYQSGLRVLSGYRGNETQFEKFLHVTDITCRICMCVVGLATLIFFKFIMRQSSSAAALNLIRMVSNAAFTNLRDDTASRIYVASVLIFLVTIQGIYQGQWAALLAKRKHLKDIDTINDLAESNYPIHLIHSYRRHFDDPIFHGNLISEVDWDDFNLLPCLFDASKNSSIACVATEHSLRFFSDVMHNVHVSRELIVKMHMTWVLRDDWPLEVRMNLVNQRFVEAGLFRKFYEPPLKEEMRKAEADYNINTDLPFKTLTLEDLNFAFAILAIGLDSSLICLVLEMAITRRKWRDLIVKIFQSR